MLGTLFLLFWSRLGRRTLEWFRCWFRSGFWRKSFKPRLALKASWDEMLSVIEGSNRPQQLVEKACEMMSEFVADARAACHEQNTGRKRSGIVSYNQEREPKKCRQLVANHGIR